MGLASSLSILCVLGLLAAPVFGLDVRVPVKTAFGANQEYPISLLKFILDKSRVDYKIIFSEFGVTTQAREIFQLKNNLDINLGWFGTSAELERDLVPIRYPMSRGLLGYRLLIINKDSQDRFDKVNSLEDLRNYRGDQGIGWSDIEILGAAGLKQAATPYDQIFAKVQAHRTDYFARGIFEAYREVELRKKEFPDLVVERHLLLVYPFAAFFFTNKQNPEIAEALNLGFKRAYSDGSFGKFFDEHPTVRPVLETANLSGRKRIDITNPLMTPETIASLKVYSSGH